MQLVLIKDRIVAHGENFLAMGGTVINTVTGAKHENATITECDGCPSDIDEVGYEYHAGVFVPCAPYGKGNNNGCFMEVCKDCATPRNSGIPIIGGLKLENLNDEIFDFVVSKKLLWENAIMDGKFPEQEITLPDTAANYRYLYIQFKFGYKPFSTDNAVYFGKFVSKDRLWSKTSTPEYLQYAEGKLTKIVSTSSLEGYRELRAFYVRGTSVYFSWGIHGSGAKDDSLAIPHKIYGVKL